MSSFSGQNALVPIGVQVAIPRIPAQGEAADPQSPSGSNDDADLITHISDPSKKEWDD